MTLLMNALKEVSNAYYLKTIRLSGPNTLSYLFHSEQFISFIFDNT